MIIINKRTPHHWKPVREERNRLLEITDKYLLPDRLTEAQVAELTEYRQQLRDITKQCEAANAVTFPAPPVFIKELHE